jgi:hypothetical protein
MKAENAGKIWPKEDDYFLEENFGKISLPRMAKRFKRTTNAVRQRAIDLGLRASTTAQGYITARILAEAVGVDNTIVTKLWIKKHKLKAQKVVTFCTREVWQIDIRDFWKWAFKNQKRFDSRKFEPLALGQEPTWMAEKRKADRSKPKRLWKSWSTLEKQRVRNMLARGMKPEAIAAEIAAELGRSEQAVVSKCQVLSQKERKGVG